MVRPLHGPLGACCYSIRDCQRIHPMGLISKKHIWDKGNDLSTTTISVHIHSSTAKALPREDRTRAHRFVEPSDPGAPRDLRTDLGRFNESSFYFKTYVALQTMSLRCSWNQIFMRQDYCWLRLVRLTHRSRKICPAARNQGATPHN